MTSRLILFLISTVLIQAPFASLGQESVFTGLRSDINRADRFYQQGMFRNALELYISAEEKEKGGDSIKLKIADTYFQLKEYQKAVDWYAKSINDSTQIAGPYILNYAEALSNTRNYEKAVDIYNLYHKLYPGNDLITEKVWRLSNIKYLKEDSIFYTVKPARIPLKGTQYSPAFYENGLVLIGYKKQIGGIKKQYGPDNKGFKTLYFTQITIDTLEEGTQYNFSKPKRFSNTIEDKYNLGPVSFFDGGKRMVYAKNGPYVNGKGSTLQLFIAEKKEDGWHETETLPFNSPDYSLNTPSITEDGSVLYFSSDMPGGFGGQDIYVSYRNNNTWSKPKNLGSMVNTSGDEYYPLIHNETLFFASNGHGGMGGLDIFKVNALLTNTAEVVNLGYPLNSSSDDFGMTLNTEGTRGFISSNRNNGGLEDSIFEIEIDLQTYPLTIKGRVKYKELDWRDSEKFDLLKNATLSLIDAIQNLQVGKAQTDSLGNFDLKIPYASKYLLKIEEAKLGEVTVSLEIPKNKDPEARHDIVVVESKNERKDSPESNNNNSSSGVNASPNPNTK